MEYWPLVKGLLTRVPLLYRPGANAAGGSIESRYCYSVWLRHLRVAEDVGLQHVPTVVAELGPGLSLGVGLAALLSGARRYLALDVARDAKVEQNLACIGELVQLYAARTPIPDAQSYPEVMPRLENYSWPRLLQGNAGATTERITEVRSAVEQLGANASSGILDYVVPWTSDSITEPASVDFMLAQAVMEHVDDAVASYQAIARWIRPGGYFSAAIDFRSHGLTRAWNGHWAYSAEQWRTVMGKRRWGLNRLAWSHHRQALNAVGFECRLVQVDRRPSGLAPQDLAPEFTSLSDDDLTSAGVYVLAVRR